MAKDYSVFDVVGPNMIGPSSSHTAGAARLGKSASKIAGKPVKEVKFLLHGSFAETYKGHGTDKALVGGILGFDPDDARIKHSFELAKEQGVKFEFIKTDLGENVHPNTVKMEMILEDGSKSSVMGASIGGGNIKLTEMDGLALDFNGARSAVVLEIKDIPGAIAFTLIFEGPNSLAKALVKPLIAAFVVEYATSHEAPVIPHIDEIFIIQPFLLCSIVGNASCVQ